MRNEVTVSISEDVIFSYFRTQSVLFLLKYEY